MTKDDSKTTEEGPSTNQNDFVIRDGFPALRKTDGSVWLDESEPEPIPRHTVWANQVLTFLNLDDWWKDCGSVFTARVRDDDQAYSAGVTYFLPAVMKPRCALEQLVKSIFEKHTEHLEKGVMTPEQSGAEWWTLILDEDDKNEDDESDEVGMHFDADYGLEDQAPNLFLHPRLATVTYLSDVGAPTIVMDRKSHPMDDREMKKLEGDVRKCWISHPIIGKHLAFDGRLLHGAPSTFFPGITKEKEPQAKKVKLSQRRVTLLVNIWINHCPLDAEPLDDDLCGQLVTSWKDEKAYEWKFEDLESASPMHRCKVSACTEDPAGEEEVVIGNRLVHIEYNASMNDLHKVAHESRMTEVEVAEGAISIRVGEEVHSEDEESEDES